MNKEKLLELAEIEKLRAQLEREREACDELQEAWAEEKAELIAELEKAKKKSQKKPVKRRLFHNNAAAIQIRKPLND